MLVRCCLYRPAREHPLGKVHAVARRVCGHHRSFLLQVRLHLRVSDAFKLYGC